MVLFVEIIINFFELNLIVRLVSVCVFDILIWIDFEILFFIIGICL